MPSLESADILILTPLPEEWQEMVQQLPEPRDAPEITPTKVAKLMHYTIVCAQCGKYQTIAAVTAQYLLDKYHPRWVIVTGIAGATEGSKLSPGDIVIAAHVYGVGGKIEKGGITRRPELDWQPDSSLLRYAQTFAAQQPDWKGRIGRDWPEGEKRYETKVKEDAYIISLDFTVDDPNNPMLKDIFRVCPEAHAFEMETVGIGSAIKFSQTQEIVGGLMIRAITDIVGGETAERESSSEQRKAWKVYSSAVAAAFVQGFISQLSLETKRTIETIPQNLEISVHQNAHSDFEMRRMLGKTVTPSAADALIHSLIRGEWRGNTPTGVMSSMIDLRIKEYLIPLIRERVQIEVTLHKDHNVRLSDNVAKELRTELLTLIDSEWFGIVWASYSDALKYAPLYATLGYGGDSESHMRKVDRRYEEFRSKPPPSVAGGNLLKFIDLLITEAKTQLEFTVG